MKMDGIFLWDYVPTPEEEEDLKRVQERVDAMQMFVPPYGETTIAGHTIQCLPAGDLKYASFLEWWFAVGRKNPAVTAAEWDGIAFLPPAEGRSEAIPKADWDSLPEEERQAIRDWVSSLKSRKMKRPHMSY